MMRNEGWYRGRAERGRAEKKGEKEGNAGQKKGG